MGGTSQEVAQCNVYTEKPPRQASASGRGAQSFSAAKVIRLPSPSDRSGCHGRPQYCPSSNTPPLLGMSSPASYTPVSTLSSWS